MQLFVLTLGLEFMGQFVTLTICSEVEVVEKGRGTFWDALYQKSSCISLPGFLNVLQ